MRMSPEPGPYHFVTVSNYAPFIGSVAVDRILEKAYQVRDLHAANINSTYYGGGVAELLSSMTLLMNRAGVRTGWHALQGRPFAQVQRDRAGQRVSSDAFSHAVVPPRSSGSWAGRRLSGPDTAPYIALTDIRHNSDQSAWHHSHPRLRPVLTMPVGYELGTGPMANESDAERDAAILHGEKIDR